MNKERSRGMGTRDILGAMGSDPEFASAWDLEEPKVALAINVARLRHQRRMTQAQLAEAAATRQPRIAEIERGDANPKFETLVRISRALGVEVEDLVRREEPAKQGVEVRVVRRPGVATAPST